MGEDAENQEVKGKKRKERKCLSKGRSNGRWHADHLNAKAEGFDCDRVSSHLGTELANVLTFQPCYLTVSEQTQVHFDAFQTPELKPIARVIGKVIDSS